MSDSLRALANASLMPLPENSEDKDEKTSDSNSLYPVLNETKLTPYPSLVELQTMIHEQPADTTTIVRPPSIEPLKNFLEKRATTIEALKQLRIRMAKHINNCKISNTVGNSASIIGGILCFIFPPVGVPVLLAGSATSLGKY